VCLPFADHHRGLQIYVDDYEQFMFTRLKEKVLDVAEKDICKKMSTIGYTWMM